MKWIFILMILTIDLGCSITESDATSEFLQLLESYNNKICRDTYSQCMYYCEYAKCKENYVMYNKGEGYLASMGYDCVIPVDNFCFVFNTFAKSNRKSDWLDNLQYYYKIAPVSLQTDLAPSYNAAISCFRRFEISGPLNSENIDSYTFKMIPSKNDTSLIEFKSNTSERHYNGIAYYNNKNLTIYRIELSECDFYSEVMSKKDIAKVVVHFSTYGEQMFISSIKIEYKADDLFQTVFINMEGKPQKNIVLSESDWNALSRNDFCPFVEYKKRSGICFKDSVKLIHDLSSGTKKIENQFIENSGKLYYECTLTNGLLQDRIDTTILNSIKTKIRRGINCH